MAKKKTATAQYTAGAIAELIGALDNREQSFLPALIRDSARASAAVTGEEPGEPGAAAAKTNTATAAGIVYLIETLGTEECGRLYQMSLDNQQLGATLRQRPCGYRGQQD
ncbi:MAG: hypothetical protein V4543_08440 [Bacteroidota bacterium]